MDYTPLVIDRFLTMGGIILIDDMVDDEGCWSTHEVRQDVHRERDWRHQIRVDELAQISQRLCAIFDNKSSVS